MKLQAYRVDAFTSALFRGSSAGVVLHTDGLSDAQMQLIACKLRYSEIVFLLISDDSDVHIRYSTPTVGVPICGHTTAAACYVWARALGLSNCMIRQTLLAGRHQVDIDATGNDYRISLK